MIGVAIPSESEPIAREFFELFKTPWEVLRPDREYDVVLCHRSFKPTRAAPLTLIYDFSAEGDNIPARPGAIASYLERPIPLYGRCRTFPGEATGILDDTAVGESFISARRSGASTVIGIGYDLFFEIELLLTTGQPLAHACTPTLEAHIAILRQLILRSGIPLAEIPPIPVGHSMIACLTHDVDHPVFRNHLLDHTMFGFLQRATVGALQAAVRGKIGVARMLRSWVAALQVPFVHARLAGDPWTRFDRYVDLEAGHPSTFFVIPKRGYAGKAEQGLAPRMRASSYSPEELKQPLARVAGAGGEIALHGLDAWCDAPAGAAERAELARKAGQASGGVRMHWLYFNAESPRRLDEAGFEYDSTVGYNETIGYRAGTTQVYRPPGTRRLRELPLHVMDTALFYPDRLNASEPEACRLVRAMIGNLAEFGGVLTVNWHDRSIAAERFWADFYGWIVGELGSCGAWFGTASSVVRWFDKRRSAVVESAQRQPGKYRLTARVGPADPRLPDLRVRLHKPCPRNEQEPLSRLAENGFVEWTCKDSIDVETKL